MHRRRYATPATLIALPLLAGGCVQMTRHSNMMIFGTNTVVGIHAGVNATSVPEVAIGYARQEAVVLPLVANVASAPAKTTTTTVKNADGSITTNTVTENGTANRLEPCNLGTATAGTAFPKGYLVHPCSLVGINDKALDSYSVLASFGGRFKGSSDGKVADADGGIAQYFATGIAAQTLALNGGAAVVAIGTSATASANKLPILATTDATPLQIARSQQILTGYDAALASLIAKIHLTANLKRELDKFEALIGSTRGISAKCTNGDDCANAVQNGDPYLAMFIKDEKKFTDAIVAWDTK